MVTTATSPAYAHFLTRPGGRGNPRMAEVEPFVRALTPGIPVRLPQFSYKSLNGACDSVRAEGHAQGKLVVIRKFNEERWVCAILPQDAPAVEAMNAKNGRKKKAA